MKILYLAHRIPYPPNKGDKIRSFNKIKHLSRSHDIDLVCLADNPDDLHFRKDLEKYCNRVFAMPFRTTQAKLKGLANLAAGKAISVGYFYSKKTQQIVDKWTADTDYDAIICFSSPMAEYVFKSGSLRNIFHNDSNPQPLTSKSKLCLLMDFCDLDSDKWLQYSNKSRFPMNFIYRLESKRLLEFEKKINQTFDHSIFVSQSEADLFSDRYSNVKNISVIPNGVDHDYFSPQEVKSPCPMPHAPSSLHPATGSMLLFTGAMDYHANIDGVTWFCEEIFPMIQKEFKELQFCIVGSNPTPKVKDLTKKRDVKVTGFVEDIRPYYRAADISVIPLRIARGIQNKVLEAMSMGKAVVTTSTAIQGISAVPGEHLLIADNPDDFADTVTMFLKDKDLRTQLGTSARQFVKTHYNWKTNMKQLENLIVGHR